MCIWIPFFQFTNNTIKRENWQKLKKTYYLCCQSRQSVCKFVVNPNRPLLLPHLTTVRYYLLLSQLTVQSTAYPPYLFGSLGTLLTWFWENNSRQETGRRQRKKNMEQSGKLFFFTFLDISQLRPKKISLS